MVENNPGDKKVVILGGFANSGKGALVYCLSEVSSIYYYDDEPRFISDPDGIMSLESALCDNWNIFQSDKGIKRFDKLIKTLCNKYKSPYFWRNTNKMFSGKLKTITEEYLSELVDFSYKGMWTGINNPIYKIIWKLNMMLKKRIFNYNKNIYVSMNYELFQLMTRKYFNRLIRNAMPGTFKYFLLNEPFASLYPSRVLNYFNDAKLIIVHRDPRDSYCNLMNETSDFMPKSVEHYIKLYKHMSALSIKNGKNDQRVLRINFEDLIVNYERTKKVVFNFLDIDESTHVHKFKYFDPNISVKNIGIWKKYKNQNDMKKISFELGEYCH
ncbi:MAG: hypothetical protein CMG69_03890 [Candidatus Marinimicrobia bacterium]|nr:hypothetical protein [Candidatus Neomarinimicrobiota bacterium]